MACVECRQQKVRCDVCSDNQRSCARCTRFGLKCVYSKSYRRQKRASKNELRKQIEQLQERLEIRNDQALSGSSLDNAIAISPSTAPATAGVQTSPQGAFWDYADGTNDLQGVTSIQQDNINAQSPRLLKSSSPFQSAVTSSNQIQNAGANLAPPPSLTRDQTLKDLIVSAQEIDDCFSLFSHKCLPYVPLVTTLLAPNECHTRSPLLFWTIVAIGSRKYVENPTLIVQLGPHVSKLAKMAIFRQEPILLTIQAFILLCCWPMPFDSISNDFTPVLAGTVLQLATSVGLHVHGVGQEFARTKISPDPDQTVARGRLWACCLIVSQWVIITNGTPPIMLPDTYDEDVVVPILSPSLLFQKRISELLTATILDLQKYALPKKSDLLPEVMDPLIHSAINRLHELNSSHASEPMDSLYSSCAELHLLSFHLLKPKACIDEEILVRMYDLACTSIEISIEVDKTSNVSEFGPVFVPRSLHSAAIAILRIRRSEIAPRLDLHRGQKAYFALILFHKKYSVRLDDAFARFSVILTQLWTSNKIFCYPDGTQNSLRVRSKARLGMSMVYDCFWWWRQEYDAQVSPYIDDNRSAVNESDRGFEIDSSILNMDPSPGGTMPDLHWPAFDNLFADYWPGLKMDFNALT